MRNFVRFTVIVAGLVALGACLPSVHLPLSGEGAGSTEPATNAIYEKSLNTWIDHPEEDIVAAWGVPERSQRLTDGGQALEYRRADGTGRILCTTLFTSDVYGRIRSWTYRGVDCRAPRLGDYSSSQ